MSGRRHLRQSRRELTAILCAWALFCLWVVGYCSLKAYPEPGSELSISFGMPSWVFWGIAVPWLCATAFTVLFSFGIFKDQPYGDLDGGEGE